jgi:peptidyl-prolyl cis-trans isomerase C
MGSEATRHGTRAGGGRLLARRLLREPLVHFGALGALLFGLWALARPAGDQAPPAPGAATAVSRTVAVTPRDLATLEAGFRASWKRDPGPEELADLVETFLGEEMLYREGLALGLDRDDVVVRRRLIEKATMLARPSAPTGEPSQAELRAWYQSYRHRFRRQAAATVEQLYFDGKRHPDPAAAARAALATLAGQAAGAAPPAGVGDSFVLPTRLEDRSELQLAHLFGPGFAAAVMAAPLGRWHGPVSSSYGTHLIRVARREPERLPPFEEIEKHVRADWLTAENRGLRAAAHNLLPRYRVELPPGLAARLAGAPALAPFLGRAR